MPLGILCPVFRAVAVEEIAMGFMARQNGWGILLAIPSPSVAFGVAVTEAAATPNAARGGVSRLSLSRREWMGGLSAVLSHKSERGLSVPAELAVALHQHRHAQHDAYSAQEHQRNGLRCAFFTGVSHVVVANAF
jgi:hypothetical protein